MRARTSWREAAGHPLTVALSLLRRSILDGYAVRAADGPGEYPVVGRIVAGVDPDFTLQPGQVAYITTGAKLPPGADAVVKFEDSELLREEDGEEKLVIARSCTDAEKTCRGLARGVCVPRRSAFSKAPRLREPTCGRLALISRRDRRLSQRLSP